jgi:hypothetical protein
MMTTRTRKAWKLSFAVLAGALSMGGAAFAEEDRSAMGTREPLYDVNMPNAAANTLTVPSGWGAWGNTIFAGAGISSPQAYSDDSDAAASFGLGIGNPVENVGLQLSATVNDVSDSDNLSYGAVVHRYLGQATSVSIGGENLFRDKDESDAGESYYLAFGHAFQGVSSETSGTSGLHGSIGVGNGRFAHKSPADVADRKGEKGSYVFGALAYEILERTNLVVEWSGINLNAGVTLAPFESFPLGIMLGAADLTDNSGDGARFIGSAGLAYQFN